MNKIGRIMLEVFLIIIFIVPTFVAPETVSAQTLGDLRAYLNQKQAEYDATQNAKALTEAEIAQVNRNIVNIKVQIEQTYSDISKLEGETAQLNIEIENKNQEMKEIVKFLQVSSGDAAYLEYAFGAKSFTDFIYRMAVSEQLAAYNDKLIDEYNNLIEENKNKQKQIEAKRVELSNQQQNLNAERTKLGEKLEILTDTGIDIGEEIKYQKEIIELYKSKGCKDDEDITTCGRETLPASTAFYRPTESGLVTSEFGGRDIGTHEGIDIGVAQGTTVYAIGNGMVATILRQNEKGGNMVIIHHILNGQTYTSVYAHLLTINVSVGQTVTRYTVVGLSGGGASTMAPDNICNLPNGTGWDTTTCGAHLHVTIALGLYGSSKQYDFWYMNNIARRNPRDYINFPDTYVRWSDRLSKY